MTMTEQRYVQLTALAQLYLLQEYSMNERIYADAKTYTYFLENTPRQAERTAHPPTHPQNLPAENTDRPSPNSTFNSAVQPPKHRDSSPEAIPAVKTEPIAKAAPASKTEMPAVVKPALATPQAIKDPTPQTTFALEPPPPFEATDFRDLRKILGSCRPNLKILDNVPNDAEAKNYAGSQANDAPRAILLSFTHPPAKHEIFLENLATALRTYGMNFKVVEAKMIEKKSGWEALLKSTGLRLIIAAPNNYDSFPELKKYYKTTPSAPGKFLEDIPLIELRDIASYFRDPSLKQQLWQAIRDHLPQL